jgi:hypothetical protein
MAINQIKSNHLTHCTVGGSGIVTRCIYKGPLSLDCYRETRAPILYTMYNSMCSILVIRLSTLIEITFVELIIL